MAFRYKSLTACVAVTFVCAPCWSGAFGKDLETLTRLLILAYVAQDFAALCAIPIYKSPEDVDLKIYLSRLLCAHNAADQSCKIFSAIYHNAKLMN